MQNDKLFGYITMRTSNIQKDDDDDDVSFVLTRVVGSILC